MDIEKILDRYSLCFMIRMESSFVVVHITTVLKNHTYFLRSLYKIKKFQFYDINS